MLSSEAGFFTRRCPSGPAWSARRDNEYKRCGTVNIFAVVEPKAGWHFNCATNRSAVQFAQVVQRLVTHYPFARTATRLEQSAPEGVRIRKSISRLTRWDHIAPTWCR